MDKIEKFFRRLNQKEREAMMLLLLQIKADYTRIPGLMRLTGSKNLFRVRMGDNRIIFKVESDKINIVRISKRSEKTYKGL